MDSFARRLNEACIVVIRHLFLIPTFTELLYAHVAIFCIHDKVLVILPDGRLSSYAKFVPSHRCPPIACSREIFKKFVRHTLLLAHVRVDMDHQ